jgi:enoyl-CoA hydratase/carnithine racemase
MSERVTVNKRGSVAEVRLNRPDKLNALDQAMFEGLAAAAQQMADDRSVRAVVLSGEGRAFCAGLDFASFMSMRNEPRRGTSLLDRSADRRGNFAQQAAFAWQELAVPVIGAIHGVAFGGGLQIALGADIRYVTADAQLSVMEIKWGLIPDMSGTQTLRRLVRLDVAKELTFTGRIISGKEAVELGLATHVSDDPRADALALAEQIAGKSPDAIRAGKRLFNEAGLLSVEEGLRLEEASQLALIGSPNQLEAVQANVAKRPPQFQDPQ